MWLDMAKVSFTCIPVTYALLFALRAECTVRHSLLMFCMWALRDGEDGCLDVRPVGRYVMAMDAESIGGSVVHGAGSAIIWGSCRGSQAASKTAGKACMVYFHLSLRELSVLFPVSASLQQQLPTAVHDRCHGSGYRVPGSHFL